MSAFRPGKTRSGPWGMTPLLLLVLLTILAGPVLCQEDEENIEDPALDDTDTTTVPPDVLIDEDTTSYSVLPPTSDTTPTRDPSISTESNVDPGSNGEETEDHSGGGNSVDYGVREEPIDEDGTVDPEEESLSPTIILIPVVLVVLIIAMVVGGIVINRRCNRKTSDADRRKADPYLDGNSTEKVPMPMFEEDVPSVLELDMEDLDQWMNNDDGAAIESDHI